MAEVRDHLDEQYTIDTPEAVTLGYAVAGIGSRFIAALIDSAILAVLLLALNIALVVILSGLEGSPSPDVLEEEENWVAGVVIALYALLNFTVIWGYYLLFEWLWHGQTVGKRVAKIRVVRDDGSPVGFLPVAIRNLVRVLDFFPAGYGAGIVTMFCNRRARRLGDFAAGTLVIKDQGELTLDALLAPRPASSPMASIVDRAPDLAPDEDWSGIRRLSADDYALVQETLARYHNGGVDRPLLRRIARVIATKMARPPSSEIERDAAHFLRQVVIAYERWVR